MLDGFFERGASLLPGRHLVQDARPVSLLDGGVAGQLLTEIIQEFNLLLACLHSVRQDLSKEEKEVKRYKIKQSSKKVHQNVECCKCFLVAQF